MTLLWASCKATGRCRIRTGIVGAALLASMFLPARLFAQPLPPPEFSGGRVASDPDVFKVELKAQVIWAKHQKEVRTCLDKAAKNHSRGKDTGLEFCLLRSRAKFQAKLAKLSLPDCWDPSALMEETEEQAKAAFSRIYCDETEPAPICGDHDVAEWEECDDGNTSDGDCCSASCTFEESGSSCPSDGNVCTDEMCDGAGTCVPQPNEASCDDGLFCTVIDSCDGGLCAGTGDPCASGDVCNDECDEVNDRCAETGTACEDGVFCTGPDTCLDGACIAGGDPCAGGTSCNSTCNELEENCFDPVSEACAGGSCDGAGICILEQGGSCASDGECTSGACVDGICCGSACDGTCQACSSALTGEANGLCAPILAGDDPDDECLVPGGVEVCDGSGSCTDCGDGTLEVGEECDDGNTSDGDCCSASCLVESEIEGCDPVARILAPSHGDFTEAGSVTVTGLVENIAPGGATLTLAGTPVPLGTDLSFTAAVAIDPSEVFQPITATLTRGSDGRVFQDRVVLLRGTSVPDGDHVADGIVMRLTDQGLDAIEPAVESLVVIDPKALIPDGTVVLNNYCYSNTIFGCLGRIDAVVEHTATQPGISGFAIDIDSEEDFARGDITLNDLQVRARVTNATGISINCAIDVAASTTDVLGDYELEPLAGTPTKVDVAQLGGVSIVFSGFSDSTSCSGLLGGIIEWLIDIFIGDIQSLVSGGLQDFLDEVDPDGNTPIAGAIESALDNIDIAGPIGDGLGLVLDTPFSAILEGPNGITFRINAGIETAAADPDAPDLQGSLLVSTVFPDLPAVTPVFGETYGVLLGFSPSTFNQLLMEAVEGGLLRLEITEVDLGSGPMPLTSGLLSFVLPALSSLPPATPLEIHVAPTLAPIVRGDGPNGELAGLEVAHLLLQLVQPSAGDAVRLSAAVDLKIGLDLVPEEGQLSISLGAPEPGTLVVALLENPLGVNPTALENLLPTMVGLILPELISSLGGFPLPSFLGTSLVPIEVTNHDDYMAIFADLG